MNLNTCNFFYFTAFIFISRCCSIVYSEQSTLKMVNVLFRHGDRTPISHYENDPYKDPKYWDEKPGELTKNGKSEEFELGKWLRTRYPDIVGHEFNPDEIHIRSTDFDRTLMSAQCVMAAFFYPNVSMRFSKNLAWMPIPIHTAPFGDDLLLLVDDACPRIKSEIEKMLQLPIVLNYIKSYADVFRYLTKYAGQKIETFKEVNYMYDTLFIEHLYNMTLPNWTQPMLPQMKEISALSFKLITMTHELKRLRGGPLLAKITQDMFRKSENDEDTKNLYIYSAHDSTVAILLNTMGVFDTQSPPYASTVLWELHNDRENGYFVRLFYQNDTSMEQPPYELVIPGCTKDCPLDKWESLLESVIPTDWNAECYRPDPLQYQYYIIGLSVIGTALILAVIAIFMLLRRNATDRTRYQALPNDSEENS